MQLATRTNAPETDPRSVALLAKSASTYTNVPTSTVASLLNFKVRCCFKKIIEYLLSRLPVTFLRLVRVSRHRPHSIYDVGPCLVGDPHEAPHHLPERHIPHLHILLRGPVIVRRGSGDRAGATNIKSLKNTPNVTLLRNLKWYQPRGCDGMRNPKRK